MKLPLFRHNSGACQGVPELPFTGGVILSSPRRAKNLVLLLKKVILRFAQDDILCGHYGCSGVQAVVEKNDLGLVSNWLRHLADVYDKFAPILQALPSLTAQAEKLCDLNITEQVRNVCESTIVMGAWKEGRPLAVHGWAYSMEDGLLRDLLKNPVTSIKESLEL